MAPLDRIAQITDPKPTFVTAETVPAGGSSADCPKHESVPVGCRPQPVKPPWETPVKTPEGESISGGEHAIDPSVLTPQLIASWVPPESVWAADTLPATAPGVAVGAESAELPVGNAEPTAEAQNARKAGRTRATRTGVLRVRPRKSPCPRGTIIARRP